MKRITITIDESVYDKLPTYGKSGTINTILKHHFQRESFDQLYDAIKQKLIRDKDINEWLEVTVREVR